MPGDLIGERAGWEIGQVGIVEFVRQRMDQVDDDAAEREATRPQRIDQVLGLADRLGTRTRHHDERRRVERSSVDTSPARRRSPGSMLASERKNSIVSSTICGPASRRTAHRNIEAAAFVTLANVRWPIVRARYTG